MFIITVCTALFLITFCLWSQEATCDHRHACQHLSTGCPYLVEQVIVRYVIICLRPQYCSFWSYLLVLSWSWLLFLSWCSLLMLCCLFALSFVVFLVLGLVFSYYRLLVLSCLTFWSCLGLFFCFYLCSCLIIYSLKLSCR